MKIVISYNVLNIKNTNTLYKFAVKIKSVISAQFQNMIITVVFFKTSQINITVQIVKNHTQHDSSNIK